MLSPTPGSTYLDCTAGLGGHAAEVARGMVTGHIILNDVDASNLRVAEARVKEAAPGVQVTTWCGNFAQTPRRIKAGSTPPADMVLADLGFSSNQMDNAARGFSFRAEAPLDMRLDASLPATAADLIASLPEDELARIITEYGEDRAARRIASTIVRERRRAPIATTTRLAEVIRSVVTKGDSPIDPATRTFQALRIAVNDELGVLEALLEAVVRAAEGLAAGKPGWLAPKARFAVISFHSLEDRLAKRTSAEVVRLGGHELSSKPTVPTEKEIGANPRARSAKLRVVELPGVDPR